MSLTQPELRLLEVFPPGRCRRILKYLAEHRDDLDNTQRCGEITFHLGARSPTEGVVSTSGPRWKPEPIDA